MKRRLVLAAFSKEYRLTPGGNTWYVWPGFGRLALGRYGETLGQSSFSVR